MAGSRIERGKCSVKLMTMQEREEGVRQCDEQDSLNVANLWNNKWNNILFGCEMNSFVDLHAGLNQEILLLNYYDYCYYYMNSINNS